MVSADINNSLLHGLGATIECYNLEIANGETLETGFDTIIAVIMTPEETQAAGTAWGYTTSSGQVTFTVDSEQTYGVVVIGLK